MLKSNSSKFSSWSLLSNVIALSWKFHHTKWSLAGPINELLGFFGGPRNPINFHLILTKLFRYVCILLGKSSTNFFYIYTYMWERGAKSLIFPPRETLPLIFGFLQKFIYQNLAKDFRKLVQKSQIASYEKNNIFNSRRGGV